jgi:hypothetical protein
MLNAARADNVPVNISLNAIAAINASDVWAIGNGTDPNDADNTDPAFEHWDGQRWQVIPAQRTLDDQELFNGAAASGPNDVWAVGSVGQPSFISRQIEIEHWNGKAWTLIDAEQVSSDDVLDGVVALAPDNAWAVGSTRSGGTRRDRALIEHWDGNQWSSVAIPDPDGSDFLHKIAAVSSNDIWAVGSFVPDLVSHPLAMRWDGSSWTTVPVPFTDRDFPLNDVVAIATDDVWAVGVTFDFNVPSHSKPLTLHWDGDSWNIVPSPVTGKFDADNLAAITASSSDDIWAIGNSVNRRQQTLAEHWNGNSWSFVHAPSSFLMNDIAAVGSNDVWAVGWDLSNSIIEHWNGVRWSIVPSP